MTKISVLGLDEMIQTFARLEASEPEVKSRLDRLVEETFQQSQALVPVDEGDERRPAGALKKSGRVIPIHTPGHWESTVEYGTESDELPYAQWAIEHGVNYMEPFGEIGDRFYDIADSFFRPLEDER